MAFSLCSFMGRKLYVSSFISAGSHHACLEMHIRRFSAVVNRRHFLLALMSLAVISIKQMGECASMCKSAATGESAQHLHGRVFNTPCDESPFV